MGSQKNGHFQIKMTEEAQNTREAKPEPKSNIVTEPKEFGYRLLGNLVVLSVIFVLAFITLLLNTDMVADKINNVSQDFYEYTSKIGFTLDDVVVTGRDKTSKNEMLQVMQIQRGDNFLKINLGEIKERLETLPWVRKVLVKRTFFPNIIQVAIEERQVRSIWQLNEKFYPIDYDGKVIQAAFEPKRPILLIVGEGAPENINALLDNISDNKQVLSRVKVANFISGRRWNLVLDDIQEGITIKLPEENVKEAWKKMLKLDATNGILKRKLTILDLRLKDKVTVKLKRSAEEKPVRLRNVKESRT